MSIFKRISFVLGGVLVLSLGFFAYLYYPGDFPDELPSAETIRETNSGGDVNPNFGDIGPYFSRLWNISGGDLVDFRPLNAKGVDYPIYKLETGVFNENSLSSILPEVEKRFGVNSDYRKSNRIPVIRFYRGNKVLTQIQIYAKENRETVAETKTETGNLSKQAAKVRQNSRRSSTLYLVVLNFGNNLSFAYEALKLPKKVYFGVIPGLELSEKISELFFNNGHKTIVQMPMEALNMTSANQGEYLLTEHENSFGFQYKIERALDEVKGAEGLANYMGSKLLKNPEKVELLFKSLRAQNKFFYFLPTTETDLVRETSKVLNLPFYQTNVLLNPKNNEEVIRQNWENALDFLEGGFHPVVAGEASALLLRFLEKKFNQNSEIVFKLGSLSR